MAFEPGYGAFFTLDGSDITQYLDSQSLDRARAVLDTTTFGNTDETSIAGIRSHGISIGGNWDSAVDAILDGADDGATVLFEFGPQGGTTGDVSYSGSCLLENYNISTDVKGKVTWSATFKPTGAVARGTFA